MSLGPWPPLSIWIWARLSRSAICRPPAHLLTCLSCVSHPVPRQAYAMMLSLSEDTPLHTSSQSPLDAWYITGATPESGAFNPISHL